MNATASRWIGRLLGSRREPVTPHQDPEPAVPTPVSVRRVADELTRRGYQFRIEGDEITGTWNGHRMWFLLLGEEQEIVCIRGRWSTTLPPDHRSSILRSVNDWNRDSVWPTAYVREEDDHLSLYAEVSVDLEHGVTDDQLADVVSCGLGSAVTFFRSVEQVLGPLPADG